MTTGSIAPLWLMACLAQDAPKPAEARAEPILVQPASTPKRRLMILEPPRAEGPTGLDEVGSRAATGTPALASENFDLWIFEFDESDEARRARLNAILEERIESARWARKLDAGQVAKLRVAGAGDIQRLFGRTAGARADFEAIRRNLVAGRRLLARLEWLAREHRAGPFDGNSLFAKVLRKVDDDARQARPGPA